MGEVRASTAVDPDTGLKLEVWDGLGGVWHTLARIGDGDPQTTLTAHTSMEAAQKGAERLGQKMLERLDD